MKTISRSRLYEISHAFIRNPCCTRCGCCSWQSDSYGPGSCLQGLSSCEKAGFESCTQTCPFSMHTNVRQRNNRLRGSAY